MNTFLSCAMIVVGLCSTCALQATQNIYNSDGTWSTVNHTGNTSQVYNSDGSWSTITHYDNSSNVYNSDGTWSTVSHDR